MFSKEKMPLKMNRHISSRREYLVFVLYNITSYNYSCKVYINKMKERGEYDK